MADRIGVMRNGRMAQTGTPREIFDMPADRFVAEFMGVANLWEGIVRADGATVDISSLSATIALPRAVPPGPVTVGVRAERLRFGTIPGENVLHGRLARGIYSGETVTHRLLAAGGGTIEIVEPAHAAERMDGAASVSFPASACLVFPT